MGTQSSPDKQKITARQRLMDTVNAGESNQNSSSIDAETLMETLDKALATLDIIVTIVGELYGQRDLLDGRAAWSVKQ